MTDIDCNGTASFIMKKRDEKRSESAPAWKPTEEELVSLGFKESERRIKYDFEHDCGIGFSEEEGFLIECFDGSYGSANIYPKSLEELKTLISMMNP